MSYLYRGISKTLDESYNGKIRPKGDKSKVSPNIGDPDVKIDNTWVIGESEENTVRAHQFESGRYDGCFVSTSRCKIIAERFATTDNAEDGYVYVIDESLLSKYGVVAFERNYQENAHELEVSLRAQDCGDIPDEIIVEKYEVKAKNT